MFKGTYEFAGIPVEINSIYPHIQKKCAKYITNKPAKYVINMTEELIDEEVVKNNEIGEKPSNYPRSYLELLAVYREFLKFAYQDDAFLFHSSTVMIDGNAYILTAPSGTGKSTHANYLKEVYKERFVIINDDKPLIRFDGKDFIAYGTPWNGKHDLDNNISAKVKGIFVLYQNSVNKIEKLDLSSSINHLYRQIYLPLGKEATGIVLNLAIKMAKEIPVYYFGCTNSIEAASVTKEIIDELNNK